MSSSSEVCLTGINEVNADIGRRMTTYDRNSRYI